MEDLIGLEAIGDVAEDGGAFAAVGTMRKSDEMPLGTLEMLVERCGDDPRPLGDTRPLGDARPLGDGPPASRPLTGIIHYSK